MELKTKGKYIEFDSNRLLHFSKTNYKIMSPDYKVAQSGNDGISSLTWSPNSNYLVSTNWDGGVRCWECQVDHGSQRVQAIPKAQGEYATQNSIQNLTYCMENLNLNIF